MKALQQKISLLNNTLKENSTKEKGITYTDELISLLVYGSNEAETLIWLESTLKPAGIERLKKVLQESCSSILKILLENIEPACQRLIYALSELHYCSLWKQKFEIIGLNSIQIEKLISLSKFLIFKSSKLQIYVSKYNKLFLAFTNWMMRVIRGRELQEMFNSSKIDELKFKEQLRMCSTLKNKCSDDNLVLEFLSIEWLDFSDSVSQLLSNDSQQFFDFSQFSSNSLFTGEISKHLSSLQDEQIVKRFHSVSIFQTLLAIDKSKNETLSKPSQAFSTLISLHSQFALLENSEENVISHQLNLKDHSASLITYHKEENSKFYFLFAFFIFFFEFFIFYFYFYLFSNF